MKRCKKKGFRERATLSNGPTHPLRLLSILPWRASDCHFSVKFLTRLNMAGRILIVTTSYGDELGDGPTGSWVEEVALPYFTWRAKVTNPRRTCM